MTKSLSTLHDTGNLLETLYSVQQQKLDVDLSISNDYRQGTIHVRAGTVLSAHTGILHGNGALLTLAQMIDPKIEIHAASEIAPKTISISLQQIQRFTAAQALCKEPFTQDQEETLLEDARMLFFQYHYKGSMEKLLTILKKNRFYYPAWLWQSRIITKKEFIEKALDEAYRWGNHDQDIWREARKIRPQLDDDTSPAKRCLFCWSILTKETFCEHCKAFLQITGQPVSSDLRKDDLLFALARFREAFNKAPGNSRVAYSLALGYFNLKDYSKALEYVRRAAKQSPQTVAYRKSLSLLLAIAKVHQPTEIPATTSAPKQQKRASTIKILMIEDSQTSRKVLSMLFKRLNYEIIEAATGKDALQIAKKIQPDLVLLDVMLPDTDGHTLLPVLRKLDHMRHCPVIMLTGKHDTHDRMQGIKAGANEYITKPFDPRKLIALVQRYLQGSSKKTIATEEPPAATPAAKGKSVARPDMVRNRSLQPNETTSSAAAAKSAGNKSIFVVEDSITSRKVLSMVLGRKGFTIHEATTGQEALTLAQSIQPDLVLLDVMLPDMTGYTVLPELKKLPHFKDLPVIMLTGKSGSADRMKGMLAGSNEYLTKPFNPEKLLAVIGAYV